MYKEFTRKINEQEIEELENYCNRISSNKIKLIDWRGDIIWLLSVGLLEFITVYLLILLFKNFNYFHYILSGFFAAILFIFNLIFLYMIIILIKSLIQDALIYPKIHFLTAKKIQDYLSDNPEIIVKQISSNQAIKVNEFEDEGNTFIFRIDQDTCFLINDIGSPELLDSENWPCSEFEMKKTKGVSYNFDIKCAGKKLHPTIIEKFPDNMIEPVYENGEGIIEFNFEELLNSLQQ